MPDELDELRRRLDRVEGRQDSESDLRAMMDGDLARLTVRLDAQNTLLRALSATQSDHTQRLARLEVGQERLEVRFGDLEVRFGDLEVRFGGLEERVGGLQLQLSGLEQRFGGLEERVGGLQLQLSGLEEKFGGIVERFGVLEERQDRTQETVGRIEVGVQAIIGMLGDGR
ncbi:MAG TPA: hypothetical protein VMF87_05360 [Streptosporangiaceae bacterium]|nr:hypothetical protein [Streptosporangiaceae bacterium]